MKIESYFKCDEERRMEKTDKYAVSLICLFSALMALSFC